MDIAVTSGGNMGWKDHEIKLAEESVGWMISVFSLNSINFQIHPGMREQ